MASKTLVESSIENGNERIKAGRALINALDKTRFSVESAFWFYMSEAKDWRFIIASNFVSHNGPKKSYEFLNKIIQQQSIKIPLHYISVLPLNDRLVVSMEMFLMGENISDGIFIKDCYLGEFYIEKAFVYRSGNIFQFKQSN